MKFEFNFEKILHHRRGLEDIARRDWLVARARLNQALQELDDFFSQIESARVRAGRIEAAGGAQAPTLSLVDDFIRGQKVRIESKRAEIRDLMAEAERLQEVLVAAAREKKILEKLKERRFEEYRLKRKKLEIKAVDELVVTRGRGADRQFNSPLEAQDGVAGATAAERDKGATSR